MIQGRKRVDWWCYYRGRSGVQVRRRLGAMLRRSTLDGEKFLVHQWFSHTTKLSHTLHALWSTLTPTPCSSSGHTDEEQRRPHFSPFSAMILSAFDSELSVRVSEYRWDGEAAAGIGFYTPKRDDNNPEFVTSVEITVVRLVAKI
jgi:hypothetical protein